MSPGVELKINSNCYLRDPMSSELGRSIIAQGVELLHDTGFENFTFKKLAEKIGTTEASVYRYFTNKRHLLVYLLNWYWLRLEHMLLFKLNNLNDADKKLSVFIEMLTNPIAEPPFKSHADENKLHAIVVHESPKAFMNKEVDADNQEGYFTCYKRLSKNLADIIKEIKPGYLYSASLSATIMDASHNLIYYQHHLPSLTEIKDNRSLQGFLKQLVS
jgi:AcrR family transcriptional regulator